MSHTFEVKHLANDRALITGTDDQNTAHQMVVSSAGFHQIEDYFADQERAAAYNAAVEEIRYSGPLVTAWSARAFACRISANCQRARPDHKYATAVEPPVFTALEPNEI